MNRELQYRTGRFPEVDPIPSWLKEEVANLSRQEQSWRRAYAKTRIAELRVAMAQHEAAAAEASAFLEWDGGQAKGGLLKHVEALIARDPEREPLYWAAMWQLKKLNSMQEEYQRWLPAYSDALEVEATSREQGWPSSWPIEFCGLWRQLGGTPSAAKAWDRAGWEPTEVLAREELQSMGRMELSQRLTALRIVPKVPENSDLESYWLDNSEADFSTTSSDRRQG